MSELAVVPARGKTNTSIAILMIPHVLFVDPSARLTVRSPGNRVSDRARTARPAVALHHIHRSTGVERSCPTAVFYTFGLRAAMKEDSSVEESVQRPVR